MHKLIFENIKVSVISLQNIVYKLYRRFTSCFFIYSGKETKSTLADSRSNYDPLSDAVAKRHLLCTCECASFERSEFFLHRNFYVRKTGYLYKIPCFSYIGNSFGFPM